MNPFRDLAGDVASQRGELADGVGRVFLGARHLQENDETNRRWQSIVYGFGSIGDGSSRDREELRQESQSVVKEMERAHRERCFYIFLVFSVSLGDCNRRARTYVRVMAGPEYGTTEAAWKGVLVESDRLSDLHTKIKDHLSEDVPTQIKSWQKDAYHKVRRQCTLSCTLH